MAEIDPRNYVIEFIQKGEIGGSREKAKLESLEEVYRRQIGSEKAPEGPGERDIKEYTYAYGPEINA